MGSNAPQDCAKVFIAKTGMRTPAYPNAGDAMIATKLKPKARLRTSNNKRAASDW